ncbi:hypothetical protein [Pseudomarimonas arenosa]|uniref:Uncharacterized protein n=1 Tax=Pseudomarimonas arenosa TaxID=2774145 RepID=A0AAW3ZJR3_9GAMM|nr:hypothetical protein [Pseudomarimonas arenosa]MBD8525754.1 hypothetical protein [Pseudomarimonas arenosa]
MLIMLLWLVSLVFWIMVLVRIGRESVLMAILTFFLWPIALVPLIRNWGQGESDIRMPFFGALIASVLAYSMLASTVSDLVSEQAMYISDEELQLIAEDDPEYAEELRRLRDEAIAEDRAAQPTEGRVDPPSAAASSDVAVERSVQNGGSGYSAPTLSEQAEIVANAGLRPTSHRPAAPLPQLISADTDLERLEAEVRQLSYRLGKVKLERAQAELALPSGFRFVPRVSLTRVARLRGTEVEPHVLGWVVHQQVSVADPDGWYIEVLYLESGNFALGQPLDTVDERAAALAGQLLADGSQRSLGSGRHAPTWYPLPGVLTWAVFGTTSDMQSQAEVLAVRLLRQGALLFVMHGVEAEREELALRATRLLANRVEVTRGQDYTDFRRGDREAPQTLLAWVAGEPVAGAD